MLESRKKGCTAMDFSECRNHKKLIIKNKKKLFKIKKNQAFSEKLPSLIGLSGDRYN